MDLSAALLERDSELAILDSAFAAAEDGRGGLVRVRGAAGLGKTRLLATAASVGTERGFLTLTAAASELEREFGFGIARQLFEDIVHEAPAERRDELFQGPAALAAPLLGIGALQTALSPAQVGDLLHAFYWLTMHVADRRPLLLVVDDLQLADAASLGYLAFLARRVKDSPVVVLAAQRAPEPLSRAAESVIAEHATELELAPLSSEGTARLAAIALGTDINPAAGVMCWEATEGNPLLLHELLTTLRVEGVELGAVSPDRVASLDPAELARSGVLRLALLSERERRLAAALATMDGRTDFANVAKLAETTPAAAAEGLERLRSLGIAAPGTPARAVHSLVRDAILGELPAAERSRLARAAAQVLDEAGADDERIAGHLVFTTPAGDAWVVDRLRSAAASAMARGAPDAAATLLERASREGAPDAEQGPVLAELGQAMYTVAPARAWEILLAAVPLLEDAGERVGCCVLASRSLVVSGDVPRAVEVLREAIDVHAREADQAARVLLDAEAVGMGRLDTRLRRQVLAGIGRLERSLPEEGVVRRIVLAVIAGERSYQARPASEMRALALEALGDGSLLEAFGPEFAPFYGAGFALLLADDAATALTQFDAALDASRSQSPIAAIPRACRAVALLRLGRPGEAEVEARIALDTFLEREEALLVPLTASALVDALLLRGAVAEAREVIGLAAAAHDGEPSISLASHFLVRRAKLAIADGDDEAALALLLAAGSEERAVDCNNPGATEWRAEAAIVALRLGRTKLAEDLAGSNLRDAEIIGGPRVCGIAERVQALVGPEDERAERLERSAELLAAAGDGVQRALSLLELGREQLRSGDGPAALERFAEAVELAERCAATAVADDAREAHASAGGRVEDVGVAAAMALTPTERRVCELAAAGESDMAIAQALLLTSRAVADHLALAYRKLGIAGRPELPGALERQPAIQRD